MPIYWLPTHWLPICWLQIEEQTFQIFVRDVNHKTITIDVKPSDSITEVKAKIIDKNPEGQHEFRLNNGTVDLEDIRKVSSYGLVKSSKLIMLDRVLGGGDI